LKLGERGGLIWPARRASIYGFFPRQARNTQPCTL